MDQAGSRAWNMPIHSYDGCTTHGCFIDHIIDTQTTCMEYPIALLAESYPKNLCFPLKIEQIDVKSISSAYQKNTCACAYRHILILHTCALFTDRCRNRVQIPVQIKFDASSLFKWHAACRGNAHIRLNARIKPVGNPLICHADEKATVQIVFRILLCLPEMCSDILTDFYKNRDHLPLYPHLASSYTCKYRS